MFSYIHTYMLFFPRITVTESLCFYISESTVDHLKDCLVLDVFFDGKVLAFLII